jgi:CheY-like chemotaxis protein
MAQKWIFIVDDDPDDRFMVQDACRESNIPVSCHELSDGSELIEHLESNAPPRPDLILLDLNMPRVDGYEVLKFLKGSEDTRIIPTIVFTTAGNEKRKALDSGADYFFHKPYKYEDYLAILKAINTLYL